jgi:hypothetical protein
MKHASAATLRQIQPLLADLRALPGLQEKSAGAFYRGGSAFLHFHEDPAGLFVDMKIEGEWTRRAISSETARKRLVRDARRLLG